MLCCALQAPILVEQGLLRVMECALWADTSFLAGLGVMDYSLLVGALHMVQCCWQAVAATAASAYTCLKVCLGWCTCKLKAMP